MEKVNVIMATYNGEKYIKEQMDSLINQTYKDIDIYIRDDGSKDKTVDIIKEYMNKTYEGRRIFLIKDDTLNRGYPNCFWKALMEAGKADYYAFCDQDDYWHSNKIEESVNLIKKYKDIPALSCCAFNYCDKDLNFIRSEHYNGKKDLLSHLFYTSAPGFTIVTNRKLIEKIDFSTIFKKNIAHDRYVQWIAAGMGKMVFNDKVLADYRRHDMAVTSDNISTFRQIKHWINEEVLSSDVSKITGKLRYFLKHHGKDLSDEDRRIVKMFVKKKSVITQFKKVFLTKRYRPSIGGEVALRLLMFLWKI